MLGWAKTLQVGHRILIAILPLVLAVNFFASDSRAEDGLALSDFITKTDTELRQQMVDTLAEEIPNQVLSKENAEFARTMRKAGELSLKAGEKYFRGKDREAAEILGGAAADELSKTLVSQIESRFSEDEPIRRLLSEYQDKPELYNKLAKAALDASPEAAIKAVGQEIDKRVTAQYDDLVAKGKDFWTRLANSLIPGADFLESKGINAAEVLADGTQEWVDTVKDLKRGKDALVFDCLHRKYVSVKNSNNAAYARESILDTGLQGFKCGDSISEEQFVPEQSDDERRNQGFLRDISDLYRNVKRAGTNRLTDTTTLAESGLNRREVVDMIEEFERAKDRYEISRTEAAEGFAAWRLKQIEKERAAQAEKPKAKRSPWSDAFRIPDYLKERYAKEYAESRFGKMMAALGKWHDRLLGAAIGAINERLGRKKVEEVRAAPVHDDFKPKNATGRPSVQAKRNDPSKTSGGAKNKSAAVPDCKPESAKNEPQRFTYHACGKPDAIYSTCWTEHCVTEAQMIGIIQRRHDSADVKIKSKEACAPPKKKAGEPNCKPAAKPDVASKEQRPAPDTCAPLKARSKRGVEQFKAGRIKDAQSIFRQLANETETGPLATNCPELAKKVSNNARKIDKIVRVVGQIKNDLTKCDPEGIKRRARVLKDVNNVRLVALRTRLLRARATAENYDAAKNAFRNGQMERSESLFKKALASANSADGPTCRNIKKRIRNNLSRISKLKQLGRAAERAARSCDESQLNTVSRKLRGASNPYLAGLSRRLSSAKEQCDNDKPLIAKCREVLATMKSSNSMAAFARGKDGNCGAAWARGTLSEARTTALANCRKRTTDCRIIAEHTHNPKNNTEVCRKALANYNSLERYSAFAMTPDRTQCGWSWGWKNSSLAKDRAMWECKQRGKGCRIIRQ